jgi:hypothetical protein
MVPEGAYNSANEWLSLMLYDTVWVDQVLSDGVGSSQHKSHWEYPFILKVIFTWTPQNFSGEK